MFHPAILHVRHEHGDRICLPEWPCHRFVTARSLFDLDGTLVDSYAALAEAVNFARREHGLHELSAAHIRDFVGDGLDTLLRRAFDADDVPRSVQDAFESRYDEICCEESTILADVEATLATLHGLGVAMAVCTNKPTSFSKKILTFLELAPYFRAIVGPDLAGARKPDAQHVLHTLEATSCAPSPTRSSSATCRSTSTPRATAGWMWQSSRLDRRPPRT